MSNPMLLLLDKNVIRKYFEGLAGIARSMELTEERHLAVLLTHSAQERDVRLFISNASFNLLNAQDRKIALAEMQAFLSRVEVLYPGKYFKRWARRLRGITFSREDAKLLSLGTFGTDEEGSIVGVGTIVTFDQSLISHWYMNLPAIQDKFEGMVARLDPPFCYAVLPELRRPEELL